MWKADFRTKMWPQSHVEPRGSTYVSREGLSGLVIMVCKLIAADNGRTDGDVQVAY